MDKNRLLEIANHIGVKRKKIFISTSSTDKEFAVKLINALDKENVDFWCMYNINGENVCHVGEDYADIIKEDALSSCCAAVVILSPDVLDVDSTKAEGVRNELDEFRKLIDQGEKIPIYPLYIKGASIDNIDIKFKERFRLNIFTRSSVFSQIDFNFDDSVISGIAKEIKNFHKNALTDKIEKAWDNEIASRKFSSLLATCSKNRCTSKTISEDIKESNELSSEKLSEAHILSNELREYDCNTYSCMIIASNLLGAEEVVGETKFYNPQKNGVKYFYYYPKKEEEEVSMTRRKIEGFIRKTQASRREVMSMIRHEFAFRNKIIHFLSNLNGMTVDDFEQQYHITKESDIARFRELFYSDTVQFYFDYNDNGDVFRLPGEVIAWLKGENANEYLFAEIAKASYKFIGFLGSFVALLDSCEDVNSISYLALKSKYNELAMLKKLDDWQERRISLSLSEAKKLTTYLLNHSESTNLRPAKKFPRLANWMSFDTNSEGGEGPTASEVDAALRNFVSIEISDNNQLKLCYSFILFITEENLTNGAWYSTGYNDTDKFVQDVVFTYNIDRQTPECDRLIDAFKFLIQINPSAKAKLLSSQSKLLEKLK